MKQLLVAVVLALPCVLHPAIGGEISQEEAAERDLQALEGELPMFKSDEEARAHQARSVSEGWRFMDRHARRVAELSAAFIEKYPEHPNRLNVLNAYSTTRITLFFDQETAFPDAVTQAQQELQRARKQMYESLEQRQQAVGEAYRRIMSAMPKDEAAEQEWLATGRKLVGIILASPTATLEDKERAEFTWFAAGMKQAWARIGAGENVDWRAHSERFHEHVRKYKELRVMGMRAEDFLGAVRTNSPEAALAGWKALLAALGDDRSSGARSIREFAQENINSIELAAAGKQFEALRFTAIDGREVDLQALKGKVVLVDFWATWCKPCVEEMPRIKAVYEKYRDQGFEVIGISGDHGSKEKLLAFLEQGGYTWPQHFDGKGTGNQFAAMFGIKSWPTSYLLDRDGKLLETNSHGPRLEAAVRSQLGLK